MTSKRKPSPTKLAIAVEGEGLAPKDIPLRYLTELLEAAAATFEALAAEKQIDPPRMSLAKVTSGSARYEFVSEDRQAARVAGAFWTAVKHRGKGDVAENSAPARTALPRGNANGRSASSRSHR